MNRPFVTRKDDLLHQKINNIYKKYRPSRAKLIENDIERYKIISDTIKYYGFNDLEVKLYHQTRVFSSTEYISLLNSYSDHRIMPGNLKSIFKSEIANDILESGDVLKVYDTIGLYKARK